MRRSVFVIRVHQKGDNNQGYQLGGKFVQANNEFSPDFTTAVQFPNKQQAEQAIQTLNSNVHFYAEIVEIFIFA